MAILYTLDEANSLLSYMLPWIVCMQSMLVSIMGSYLVCTSMCCIQCTSLYVHKYQYNYYIGSKIGGFNPHAGITTL